MNIIGECIRKYRLLKGLTQSELGRLIGYNAGTIIYNWENGNGKPDYMKIRKLCTALNVTADQLIGLDSNATVTSFSCDEVKLIKDYRFLDSYGKDVIDANMELQCKRVSSILSKSHRAKLIQFDIYDIPASAGTGNFLESATPNKTYIKETPETENADFLIKVSGDSMEPTFHDGDAVLVKKQNTLEIGDIGIFFLNNDSYIKEFGSNELISHNKAYKPIKITESDTVYCFGKVVGIAEF